MKRCFKETGELRWTPSPQRLAACAFLLEREPPFSLGLLEAVFTEEEALTRLLDRLNLTCKFHRSRGVLSCSLELHVSSLNIPGVLQLPFAQHTQFYLQPKLCPLIPHHREAYSNSLNWSLSQGAWESPLTLFFFPF